MEHIRRGSKSKTPSFLSTVACSVLAVPLTACMSITPASKPILERATRPVFDAVSVVGLGFRDERLSSRTEASAVAYGSSVAIASLGGISGSAAGSSFGSAAGSSRTFKSFENRELQEQLRHSLEESGITRRVVADAPIRIEGSFGAEADTGAGRILFNIVNTIPLLGMFPYLGSTRAIVNLRVYHNDELLGAWQGTGRSNWSRSFLFTPGFALGGEITEIRNRAMVVAGHLAARDAVAQMANHADQLAGILRQRGPGPYASGDAPAMHTPKKETSLCEHRWATDRSRRDRCLREQRDAFRRLGPTIARVKASPSAEESKALRRCYSTAQLAHGTDWEMLESCYLPQPAAPARY